MLITPHFELSQTEEFVLVRIKLPYLKADEGEFYIDGCEFKFHLKPYFLRLTFRQPLVEDDRERAEHDIDSGVLTVWLPKATAGQHFEGLDMLTELLRKPARPARGPLIEVIGSSEAAGSDGAGGPCASEDGDGMDVNDTDDGMSDIDEALAAEAEVEQTLPSLLTAAGCAYGFDNAHSGVFAGLESDELLLNPTPEVSESSARRSGRIAAEDSAFSPDHYMADFMEDELAQAAIEFRPWWSAPGAEMWRDEAPTAEGESGTPGVPASAPPLPFGGFSIGSEHQAVLLALPKKEWLLDVAGRRRALCGLVDLLFAYAYDVRTTEGESTVESGWTVRHLSSQLSWLDSFDSVGDACVACVRRSLCYPLVRVPRPPPVGRSLGVQPTPHGLPPQVRHLGLSRAVVGDVVTLLRLGRRATLRALLDLRATVQRGGEHGYLLNRVWTDDYCVWLQQLRPQWLGRLAEKLEAVPIRSDHGLGWPLAEYEALAQEEGGEEGEV